jgi:hypothetical protein
MRPLAAITWEFFNANRRGWMLVLAAFAICAILSRTFGESIQQSEGLRFMSYLPLVASLILAISFCNFTDRNRRDGIAGFPRHLFALPASTGLMVTCAITCSLLSVEAIFVMWAEFVLEPLNVAILVRWPAILLATFVVLYQAIIWCLCGFRLTRVVSLSFVATFLVAVGFFPSLIPQDRFWSSETNLSATLVVVMAAAYVTTLVTVNAQRRGGARGWPVVQDFVELLARAIPRRQAALNSPDAALLWMEWRRAGILLPVAVLVTTAIVLGPVLAITGRGREATTYAEMWLFIMPILLAFPIGLGFGKPDFWSLDLALSPFVATRPITAGQMLAAKMKSAAWSALSAWALLLLVAPLCIYLFCETKHWGLLWNSSGMLYSPMTQWLLPVLFLFGAILLTWSLLVANIWLGYCGRPVFFYSVTGFGLTAFLTWFFLFAWWLDHPRSRGDSLTGMLPWLPWALAALVTVKVWLSVLVVGALRRCRLISDAGIFKYAFVWLASIACLMLGACLMSPRIEWFRNMTLLGCLVAVPLLTLAIAPFTIAWNRHR